jgi:hypothetical protein
VRRSTIGIALRQFGAIGGGRGVAFVQRSRRSVTGGKGRRERKREKEREREKTESVLTLTFGNYPCSYERGTGGSALILAVRISSGVEKKIQKWGVSK